MVQKYADLIDRTTQERQFLDEKTKRTKYARPGYKFIEAHTKVDGLWLDSRMLFYPLISYPIDSFYHWTNFNKIHKSDH